MLGHVQGAAHLQAISNFSHQENRIGIGKEIACFDRATDQVIQHDLVCRAEHQASDCSVIVLMRPDVGGVLSIGRAEKIPGNPVRFLVQDLMVDVFEQVELKRLAGTVGRFDPINDTSAYSMDKISIEETNGRREFLIDLCFPDLQFFRGQICRGHAAS